MSSADRVSQRRQQRAARQAHLVSARRGAADHVTDQDSSSRLGVGAQAVAGLQAARREQRAGRQAAAVSQSAQPQHVPGRTPPRSHSPQPPAPARRAEAWGPPDEAHSRAGPHAAAVGAMPQSMSARKEARRARLAALGLGTGGLPAQRPAATNGEARWAGTVERGQPDARASGPPPPSHALAQVSPEEGPTSRMAMLEAELAAMKRAKLEAELATLQAEKATGAWGPAGAIDQTERRAGGTGPVRARGAPERNDSLLRPCAQASVLQVSRCLRLPCCRHR